MKVSEEIKKLAEFMPEDAKQQIFDQLLECCPNEEKLAEALGFDSSFVKIWQMGDGFSKERFPEILALALHECPSTKSVIKNALNEFSFLCDGLNIAEKEGQDKVSEFMEALDAESRTIVWHLIRTGYARINELSALISLNDSLTLGKINEVINPTAKKILGKPILLFRQAGFNSGKKVLFSWWIDESMQLAGGKKKEIVEICNEKDFLMVTVALPYMDGKDVMVSVGSNCLSVFGKNAETSFFQRIPLYCTVKKIKEKTFNNGVLEIKLEKDGQNGLYQMSKEVGKS